MESAIGDAPSGDTGAVVRWPRLGLGCSTPSLKYHLLFVTLIFLDMVRARAGMLGGILRVWLPSEMDEPSLTSAHEIIRSPSGAHRDLVHKSRGPRPSRVARAPSRHQPPVRAQCRAVAEKHRSDLRACPPHTRCCSPSRKD